MVDTAALNTRETVLLNAITERLREMYPAGSSKRSDASVAESNGGQYRLQTDIESVRSDFHDFKTDVNLRFSEISTGIKGLEQSIGRLMPAPLSGQVSAGGNGEPKGGLFSGILGVATICLALASAFGAIVKMNIDTNVTYAQERTTTAEKHLVDDLGSLAQVVKRIQETTIPRPELENRLTFIREQQETKADKDVIHQVVSRIDGQIGYLRSDIERLKGDIVTRRENEGHWGDFQNRVNLLSERINDLAKSTNGTSLADQIKALQEQISALQQKLIVVTPR